MFNGADLDETRMGANVSDGGGERKGNKWIWDFQGVYK
jgi:hypothetical protein